MNHTGNSSNLCYTVPQLFPVPDDPPYKLDSFAQIILNTLPLIFTLSMWIVVELVPRRRSTVVLKRVTSGVSSVATTLLVLFLWRSIGLACEEYSDSKRLFLTSDVQDYTDIVDIEKMNEVLSISWNITRGVLIFIAVLIGACIQAFTMMRMPRVSIVILLSFALGSVFLDWALRGIVVTSSYQLVVAFQTLWCIKAVSCFVYLEKVSAWHSSSRRRSTVCRSTSQKSPDSRRTVQEPTWNRPASWFSM